MRCEGKVSEVWGEYPVSKASLAYYLVTTEDTFSPRFASACPIAKCIATQGSAVDVEVYEKVTVVDYGEVQKVYHNPSWVEGFVNAFDSLKPGDYTAEQAYVFLKLLMREGKV